ncbi:NAD(P)H-nitrite reductase large subunit [Anaerosolibacter carboniphilus]|uniref:NAD(P)H-nitrite reductase large subunit n=1 Tax=Anaerosolibacter carboniphilus TaxID=1417629 RepID=A0A841KWU9_9FIRM|nr:FAD-dependent oxidoreductase [Anaerosolibacter carboniphilus]MBB6217843.1 NAD(P)H-nitrite reductase large subunit [Anaerosolibacter carboniphilus]
MRYVIIGASAAGIHAVKTLRKLDEDGQITVISQDEKIISRCMLHHVISGNRDEETSAFVEGDWTEKYNIQWLKGTTATEVAVMSQEVILDDGKRIPYDKLLIASGADAILPPVKGLKDGANVFTLRNLKDVREIISAIDAGKSAVVIGGGLIGIDASMALIEKHISVTIVEMANRILPLQLDHISSCRYKELLGAKGAVVREGVSVVEIEREGNRNIVRLNNGMDIRCDMIIVAAGVKPNRTFIDSEKLKVEKGILVNDKMETTIQNIYAAGDVTGKSAIWPVAVKQGIVAASNMAGVERYYEDYFTEKNTMNVFGLKTISLGLIEPPDDTYKVEVFNNKDIYKKVIHKNNVIYGMIFQGDISRSGFWSHLIKEKIKIDFPYEDIFALQYADFYGIDPTGNYVMPIKS